MEWFLLGMAVLFGPGVIARMFPPLLFPIGFVVFGCGLWFGGAIGALIGTGFYLIAFTITSYKVHG